MGTMSEATQHARGRYARLFGRARHPVQEVEAEAHHLHETEQTGESGQTPYIAILGLLMFLVPVFLVLLGLALAAYYLA